MATRPEEMHAYADRGRDGSIMALLRDLRNEAATMIHQNMALAKAELSEKSERGTRKLAMTAAGGGLAFAGLIILLMAASTGLAVGLEAAGLSGETAAWLAPLGVGLLTALIGWALLAAGKRGLKKEMRMPQNTVDSLKETKRWAQYKATHGSGEADEPRATRAAPRYGEI